MRTRLFSFCREELLLSLTGSRSARPLPSVLPAWVGKRREPDSCRPVGWPQGGRCKALWRGHISLGAMAILGGSFQHPVEVQRQLLLGQRKGSPSPPKGGPLKESPLDLHSAPRGPCSFCSSCAGRSRPPPRPGLALAPTLVQGQSRETPPWLAKGRQRRPCFGRLASYRAHRKKRLFTRLNVTFTLHSF